MTAKQAIPVGAPPTPLYPAPVPNALSAGATARLAHLMVEHQRAALVLLDHDLRLLTLNPAAEELLGLSFNQSVGQSVATLLPECELFCALLNRALASGESLTERDMLIAHRDKADLSVDCVMAPVQSGGRIECLLVELWHLDRHKQLTRETTLTAQHEAAREVMRGLAHEVKNPLGGLRGAAQLLEHELSDDSLKEYTRVIVREADRLSKLVDRMLGPRAPPQLSSINLHEVTERVYALAKIEAPAGVRLERDYDPSIPEIDADAELLIQALLNIARNALQAVGESGRIVIRTRVHRQINFGMRHHRMVAGIDIVDNGPGIEPVLEGQIFYPLVSGRSDGSGLGLSIAHSIVTQHAGAIEHRCRAGIDGGETTFSILIPVRETNPGPQSVGAASIWPGSPHA